MSRTRTWNPGAWALAATLALPGVAAAAEQTDAAVEEIIAVLRDRGLIDAEQHDRLLAKHRAARRDAPGVGSALTEGWEWSGDLRLRYEGFRFDRDATGSERTNRYRARYRARLALGRQVNDWLRVGLRLASGDSNPRSTNKTLGSSADFDRDAIAIDRAWAELALPDAGAIESSLRIGKFSNPFTWSHGKDLLTWDGDLNPEGVAWVARRPLGEDAEVFGRVAVLAVEERSTDADPKLFGVQLGGTGRVAGGLELGLRISGYEWRSLGPRFIGDATAFGNLTTAFDGRARIGSLTGFARLTRSERWPLLLFAAAARNFGADRAVLSGVSVDEEDLAWGVGVEAGSAKRTAKLGLAYYRMEANAVVAQFTDSDVLDGVTNRKGWYFYASRKLWPATEVKLEVFDGEEIEDDGGALGPFVESIRDADRTRFRTDFIVEF